MHRTAVIFEQFAGNLRAASWEALRCALEVSENTDDLLVVICGDRPRDAASEISTASGRPVLAIDTGEGSRYHSERTKSQLTELFREKGITRICLAGTTQGLDFGPGLAFRLGIPCLTGVEKVERKDGALFVGRSIYGGKVMETSRLGDSGVLIVTQPGTFKPYSGSDTTAPEVELISIDGSDAGITPIEVRQVQAESSALAEAAIIVAAGRGIGEIENLDLIRQLAEFFPRSAVGGSRPLCDLEWLEYRQQVGITGATVTPELYLACGISGAAQHISGMRNAGLIISVNIDPKAAIFNYSDVCIVEDLTTFIPVFIETFKTRQAG